MQVEPGAYYQSVRILYYCCCACCANAAVAVSVMCRTMVGGTLPGGLLLRGLSGGERKRLSIAAGIIAAPSIVFLDEPTSGLDSFAALTVMGFLKRMARDNGHVVIASIHQPRSAIWSMFDKVSANALALLIFFMMSWGAGQSQQCSCPACICCCICCMHLLLHLLLLLPLLTSFAVRNRLRYACR